MAASATFALKVAVWFRRGRLFMVSPDSLGTACPLSGRNCTYRSVQISETSSTRDPRDTRPISHITVIWSGRSTGQFQPPPEFDIVFPLINSSPDPGQQTQQS